jgi:hypothetical protein
LSWKLGAAQMQTDRDDPHNRSLAAAPQVKENSRGRAEFRVLAAGRPDFANPESFPSR